MSRPPIGVLVVDDDFRVASVHAEFAAAVPGFTVTGVAHSAAQARARIQQQRPDLVLLDVYLPDASGLDLLRHTDVDAFVLTAADDPGLVAAALRAGALHYLVKPFTGEQLAGRLAAYREFRGALGGGRMTQQAVDSALRALRGKDSAAGDRRSPATTKLISELLRAADGRRSAAEVAAELGIARATAARHLGALAEEGSVRMTLRYGSTGRPEQEYAPNDGDGGA